MPPLRLSHFLPLLLLPSLWGCGSSGVPEGPPPLSAEALAAVSQDSGVAHEKLARAIDAAFTDEALGETRAMVVMHGGSIVAERYATGYGPETRMAGWSMSKCVTGLLIGLLVADGRLRLNETAPVPAWQRSGDPRGEITLRQLLQMRAGLRHTETADPIYASDTVRMLFLDGRDNMAAYAEAQPLEFEPGRKFEYSSATSVILSDIATRAITTSENPERRRKAMLDYLRPRLFDPVGLTSMVPEFDAAGTMIGSSLIHATARDWAKLGEFLRHGGSVKGAQIVPRGWVEFMRRPSPRNEGYGAQLWLNRPQAEGSDVLFPGKAPESLFACAGHLGQYVLVSPPQKLTLVRLGVSNGGEREVLRSRLADIVALFPRR